MYGKQRPSRARFVTPKVIPPTPLVAEPHDAAADHALTNKPRATSTALAASGA
jgi:hypothetical protein